MTKETVEELLKEYVDKFEEAIDYHATVYKLIGSGTSESPMWFQYTGIDNLRLKFVNSQKSQMYFTIPLNDDDVDLVTYSNRDWVYEFFRNLKYSYLKENHPSVYSQIKTT